MNPWRCIMCGKEIKDGEKYSECAGFGKMCMDCTKINEDIANSTGNEKFSGLINNSKLTIAK